MILLHMECPRCGGAVGSVQNNHADFAEKLRVFRATIPGVCLSCLDDILAIILARATDTEAAEIVVGDRRERWDREHWDKPT